MINVQMSIPELNIEFNLFYLKSSKDNIEEIKQALVCEKNYNNTEFDFGKIIYQKD